MLPMTKPKQPPRQEVWRSDTHCAKLESRCDRCSTRPDGSPCSSCLEKVDRHFHELIVRHSRRRAEMG